MTAGMERGHGIRGCLVRGASATALALEVHSAAWADEASAPPWSTVEAYRPRPIACF